MDVESVNKCIGAANRRVREIRERYFPPSWAMALQELKNTAAHPETFATAPSDLLHDLLYPTPNTLHGDDVEEEFRVRVFSDGNFGRLLCLWQAIFNAGRDLVDDGEEELAERFALAARLLDATTDREIFLVCLDVESKRQK